MLSELFKDLERVASSKRDAAVLKIPGIASKVLVREGETFTWRDVEAPRRAHKFTSLDALLEASKLPVLCKQPEVYVDKDKIHLLADSVGRTEVYTLNLEFTPTFKYLCGLANSGTVLSQSELVNVFRLILADYIPKGITEQFKAITWASSEDGESVVGHGKDSLGVRRDARVRAKSTRTKTIEDTGEEGELPSEIELRVPVFATPGFSDIKESVRLGIVIDTEDHTFALAPLGDDIANAKESAHGMCWVNTRAACGQSVPVFRGTPVLMPVP